jgi:hypothetical protein
MNVEIVDEVQDPEQADEENGPTPTISFLLELGVNWAKPSISHASFVILISIFAVPLEPLPLLL